MVKLNLGSGIRLMKEFVSVDKFLTQDDIIDGWKTKQGQYKNAEVEVEDDGTYPEFVQADILSLPFPDAYADYALLDNVLEHISMSQLLPVVKEVRRVLKPGGSVVIDCPDFNGICKLWIEHVGSKMGSFSDWSLYNHLAEIAYGNQAGEGEFHRSPITADLLNALLHSAGFDRIQIELHKMGAPSAAYDGCRAAPEGRLRNDTLVARASVPIPQETPGGELSFCVSDGTKVQGGLR
jgi:predicted SAM-dependent methyltransferase